MQTTQKSFKCNSSENYKLLANFLYSLGFKMGGEPTAQGAIDIYARDSHQYYYRVNFQSKVFNGHDSYDIKHKDYLTCASFGEFVDYVMEGLKVKPIDVVLNGSLTAVVTKTEIAVGCQKFSHEVITQLVKICKETKNGNKTAVTTKTPVLKLGDKSEVALVVKMLYAMGFKNNGKSIEDAIKHGEYYYEGYRGIVAHLSNKDIDNSDPTYPRGNRQYFDTLGTFIDYIVGVTKIKPVEFELNKDYKAVITKEGITVSSHSFTHEAITELGRAILSIKQI